MAYDNPEDGYLIVGAKGGGKGGGTTSSSRSATEAPNTLQSFAIARIMDLISSGEIEGWADADPLKCVFLDGTPIKNPDGTTNFTGIKMDWRVGTPDQDYIDGYDDQGSTIGVEIEATSAISPIYTVTNSGIDAISVGVAIPALVTQDKKTGDVNGGTVQYVIETREAGSSVWVERLNKTLNEKFTSPLQIAHRIGIRDLASPVSVRLRRITPDSTDSSVQNKTFFAFVTELTEAKLTYPNSAIVGLTAEAKQFGDRVPARTYYIKGQKCLIPTNYDPVTRNYSGIWDGTLKLGWTRNPAWILLSILVNKDWGMGDLIDIADVDRYGLYEIAQYCDELVPDGYGGQEPRYQFDAYIQTREEASKAVQAIASTFQGMIFATSAKVLFAQDRPKEVKRLVTNANVIGGSFVYEGFSRESRHSVAVVTWSDPAQLGKPSVEVVEDPELIDQLGWKPTDVFAYGCTSRGQARRVGKWVLFSSKYETRTCSFRASIDFADVTPGSVLRIADQHRQGIRAGGRLLVAGPTSATLDAPFDFQTGVSYTLWMTKPDGTLTSKDLTVSPGVTANVTWSGSLAGQQPQDESVYIITSTDFSPPLYKVLSIKELGGREPHVELVCVRHYEEKFNYIEYDIPFDPTGETIYGLSTFIAPPTNPSVRRITNVLPSGVQEFLEVSFTKSTNRFVFEYPYRWRFKKGTWEEGKTVGDNFLVPFRGDGYYDFIITARGPGNRESIPLAFSSDGNGNIRPIDDPFVRNLRISGNDPTDLIFGGRVLKVEWDVGSPTTFEDTDDWIDPYFRDFEITIARTDNVVLRSYYTTDQRFEYTAEMVYEDNQGVMIRDLKVTVAMRDTHGDILGSATKTFSNPSPAAPSPSDIVITSRIGGVNVYVKPSADRDIQNLLVWISTDSIVTITESPWLITNQHSFEVDRPAHLLYWMVLAYADDWWQSIDELNYTAPILLQAREITLNDLDAVIQQILADAQLISQDGTALTQRLRQLRFEVDDAANAIIENALRDVTIQAYIDAKTHLEGVEIGTVLVQESNERIEGDAAIRDLISLIGAKSGDGLAFILDSSTVKVSPTESLAERLTAIQAQLGDDIQAQILTESIARTNADEALASQITTLGVQLGDTAAAIAQEAIARANGDSAEATARQNLAAQIAGDISAAVLTESTARTSADNALANIISKIGALNGNGTAFVFDASTAQVSNGVSLATRLSGIDTAVANVNASIANEVIARSNAISAEATARQTLQTTVNGHTTSINSFQTTINGLVGKAGVLIDNNGNITGWQALSGPGQSWFSVIANRFIIVDPSNPNAIQAPFEVNNGVVRIPYAEVAVLKARITQDGSFAFTGYNGSDLGSTTQVAAAGYVFPISCACSVIGHFAFSNFNSGTSFVRATLRRDGNNLYEVSAYAFPFTPGYGTIVWYDFPGSGYHWYDIVCQAFDQNGGFTGNVIAGSASLSLEGKLNWR